MDMMRNVGDRAGLTGMGDVKGITGITGMDYGKGARSGNNTMASTLNAGSAMGMLSPPQKLGYKPISTMGIAGGLTLNQSQENLHGNMYESMMQGMVGSPRNTVHGHYPASGFNSHPSTANRLEIQTPSMTAMQVPLNAGYDTSLKGID